jgi:hypothetical protein
MAVFAALRGRRAAFVRTPKYGDKDWRTSGYVARVGGQVMWEVGLGVYAMFGATLALRHSPSMVLYFVLYAVGFLTVASWSAAENWSAARAMDKPRRSTA